MGYYSRSKKNKKGFVGDVMTIILFLFITAIVILIAYKALGVINDGLQASDDIADRGKEIMQDSKEGYVDVWDGIFGFMLVGLSIAAVIGAYMVDTHPVFMVLSLIVLAAFIIVSATMSNAYYEVESNSAFSTFAEDFKIMHYITNHLPYYVVVEGILITVALFAKSSRDWV